MSDQTTHPRLAKLDSWLRGGTGGPVLRPPIPKHNLRHDYFGPREPEQQDIAQLLGEEHFAKPVPIVQPKAPRMYTIGQLAAHLERHAETIHLWRRNGWIPEADHWTAGTNNGWGKTSRKRLYTDRQVKGLRQIAHEEGLLADKHKPVTSTNFKQRAYDWWDECAADERAMLAEPAR